METLLSHVMEKIIIYAPESLKSFNTRRQAPVSDPNAINSVSWNAVGNMNHPDSNNSMDPRFNLRQSPGSMNTLINNGNAVQPPINMGSMGAQVINGSMNSNPNSEPANAPPAQFPMYLKEHHVASIILQAVQANNYPRKCNDIITSHHTALGNAAPVVKTLAELVSDLKALEAISTEKRNMNKWARSTGYMP